MFSRDRGRLLTMDMSRKVLAAILAGTVITPLLSEEHFSVEGIPVKT